jgi:hypothetical protein
MNQISIWFHIYNEFIKIGWAKGNMSIKTDHQSFNGITNISNIIANPTWIFSQFNNLQVSPYFLCKYNYCTNILANN